MKHLYATAIIRTLDIYIYIKETILFFFFFWGGGLIQYPPHLFFWVYIKDAKVATVKRENERRKNDKTPGNSKTNYV